MTELVPTGFDEAGALFVRDGAHYVGTAITQGGWDPRIANGGCVLALVGHCLDEVATLVPMSLARLTADLHRPVPVGVPLRIDTEIVREGKKLQLTQLRVMVGDEEHARVSALRLRETEIADGDIESTTTERPGDRLARPDDSMSLRDITPVIPGFLYAFDMRRAETLDGTASGAWIRLTVPVIEGEAVSPSARLAGIFDFANLVGMNTHPERVSMINPDVSAHVLRPPTSEWIAITGSTRFEPALGRGFSMASYSDDDGVFGSSSISQLLQPR